MYQKQEKLRLTYFSPGWQETLCCFTSRLGGYSQESLASLNLGKNVGDQNHFVEDNWALVKKTLDIQKVPHVAGYQVHGHHVQLVQKKDLPAPGCKKIFPDTDALVTRQHQVLLTSIYADCVPLVFYDPINKAIGMAHGGWRGTLHQIGLKALQAMEQHFDTKPACCLVGIGPSIGPCCYQVAGGVVDAFANWPWPVLLEKDDGCYLDLWSANYYPLVSYGVKPEHINRADMCTCCNQEYFYSHRGSQGQGGRMASLLLLY